MLYLIFFKLGITNFGGGYAMLPLLERELVTKRGWVTSEEITDYYAIGQVTPGAIAVNVSTFIGMKKKGVLGGIVATLGFITPAFLIIFLIASLLTSFASNSFVQNALAGIRVCVFVLVLYAIIGLFKKSIHDIWALLLTTTVAIMAITIDVIPLYAYVIFAAAYGLFISWLKERKAKKYEVKKDASPTEMEEEKVEEINVEPVEEKVEEAKPKKKINFKDIGIYLIGFLVGGTLGIFGLFTFYLTKNKKYKTGVASSLLFWFIFLVSTLVMVFNNGNGIFFTLYFQFFKIGLLALGGGLATLPFLSELGLSTGWYNELDIANMLAVSESTPGAIGVNMSTYVGYTVTFSEFNGNYFIAFLGSIISTLGLVSPSIILIVIISLVLRKFKDNKYVAWLFYGLRAASIGLIIAALYSILKISIFNIYIDNSGTAEITLNTIYYAFNHAKDHAMVLYSRDGFFESVGAFFNLLINFRNLALALALGIGVFKFKKHPLIYIAIAAVFGIIFNMYEVTYV